MKKNDHRLRLLNQLEHQHYYARPKFTEDEQSYYFMLSDEEMALVAQHKNMQAKLYFMLALGYFKAKRRFFRFRFPTVKDDVRFVKKHYLPEVNLNLAFPSRNIIRNIHHEIITLHHFTTDTATIKKLTQKKVAVLVTQKSCPSSILQALLDYYEHERVILPTYSTLQDIIGRAITEEGARLKKLVSRYLDADVCQQLDTLLTMDDDDRYYIHILKSDPKDFKYQQMQQHIERLLRYKPLYKPAKRFLPKLNLSLQNIDYYASLADYYNSHELKSLPREKAYLYLMCYLYYRLQTVCDQLIESFSYHIHHYLEAAQSFYVDAPNKKVRNVASLLATSSKLLRFYNNDTLDTKQFKAIRTKAYKLLSADEIEKVCQFLEKNNASHDFIKWQYFSEHAQLVSKNLRPLFLALDFQYQKPAAKIRQAVTFLQDAFCAGKSLNQYPYTKWPKAFLPRKLKRHYNSKNPLSAGAYEFMVYWQIREHLKKGYISCRDSSCYRRLEDDVASVIKWNDKKAREKLLSELNIDTLTTPIETILADLKTEITELFEETNANILSGKNTNINYSKKDGVYTWTFPQKRNKDVFDNPFYNKLPHIDISTLLDFVDKRTGLFDCFVPLKSYNSKFKPNKSTIKGCIIANATGIGIYKMGELSDLIYHQLYDTQKQCVRLDNLKAANDKIVNAFAKLPIFKHYNVADKLLWANADGSKYKTRRKTFKSRHSRKYFALGQGLVSYTSVMNNIGIAGLQMGANEHESHYLHELINSNTTDLIINCMATDTEGSNRVNFPLLELSDIEYTPCYRSLSNKAETMVSFKHPRYYQNDKCVIRPGKQVKEQLIIDEWDNILPILAASASKEIKPSIIVKKLSSHDYSSRTKEALWEYNQLLMTRYLLNYINDPDLAGYVRTALNRGEAFHALKRSINGIRDGQYRGMSDREAAIWDECTRLVANAIIFYNAYLLSILMEKKEAEGDHEAVAFIRKLSPIASQHINLGGLYEFIGTTGAVDIEGTIELLDKLLNNSLL